MQKPHPYLLSKNLNPHETYKQYFVINSFVYLPEIHINNLLLCVFVCLLHSMPNLDAMFQTGLYINDLSMHDSSRDLVLAGTQQSAELKLALDQVK